MRDMEVRDESELDTVVKKFKNCYNSFIKSTENSTEVKKKTASAILSITKQLYDHTKSFEVNVGFTPTSDALSELIIENFDEEQIWQELELQNEERCDHFITDLALLTASKNRLNFLVDNGSHHDEIEDDESDEEGIQQRLLRLADNKSKPSKKKKRERVPSSVVDDKFFKLREMEKFLDEEDKKESGSNEVDDDLIDFFEDIPSDEDDDDDEDSEEENESERTPKGSRLKYDDFFDSPDEDDGEDENEVVNSDKNDKTSRKVRFNVEDGGDEDDDDDDDDDDEDDEEMEVADGAPEVEFSHSDASEEEKEESHIKSSFEARQERLKAKISKLEEQALEDKPWTLKGEVTAEKRPENSLLEEVVEFDVSSRPAPVRTVKTTERLEDIIKQRIKDKAWDDVERKHKPTETPMEYRKRLVLDQEKSKLSLAQIYEQEYLKQKEAASLEEEKPEEEPPEYQKIRSKMASLFAKLDALSNYHYTPKLAVPEMKVISNLPAITVEEVAPVAASDAQLLAPEEVKAKPKGNVMSKDERSKTDMKRERRKKKALQRTRKIEKEKKEAIIDKIRPGLGNPYSKKRLSELLDKVTKDPNVNKMTDKGDDKAVRSSTAFFSKLQDEVKSSIKTKISKPTETKKRLSAKRLKM